MARIHANKSQITACATAAGITPDSLFYLSSFAPIRVIRG
jgi:hypothetical protein